MTVGPPHIVLIEPDPKRAESLSSLLTPWRVAVLLTPTQALEHMRRQPCDVILLHWDGADPTPLRSLQASAAVVALVNDAAHVAPALHCGACDAIPRGELTAPLLMRVVRHVVDRRRFEAELGRLQGLFDERAEQRARELEVANRQLQKEISEQHRLVEALRLSEQQFRDLFESSPDPIFVEDIHGNVLDANPAACHLHEMERAELLGMNVLQLVPPDCRLSVSQIFPRLAGGECHHTEGFSWTKSKQKVPVELRVNPIRYQNRPAVLLHVREMTQRKQTEEALRESQLRFQAFMDHLPALAWIVDTEGRIEYANRGFGLLAERPVDQIVGKYIHELVSAEYAAQYQAHNRQVAETGQPLQVAETYPRMDGTVGTLLTFKFPLHDQQGRKLLGGIGIDITDRVRAEDERRKMESQLQQMQRLDSLGVMAGGIAHDFNNLLTGVFGYADLALLELAPTAPVRGIIEQIVTGARRAAELTRQMLAYSGKGKFVVRPLDLAEVIDEMGQLLQVSIAKKCSLQYDFAPHLPAIEADAAQLRQVIMNLILNACEAIGQQPGVITLRTGVRSCDRAFLADTYCPGDLPEGLYVMLEVVDTGCGMTPEVARKIFDPFFTTKFTGRGLGLAAALGIIRGHAGAVRVASVPGQGSSFQVYFPASAKPPIRSVYDEAPRLSWRGHGLVLLADDEEMVRNLAEPFLRIMGFDVVAAADGFEALEIFRQRGPELRLALLDFTMPNMDGVEVLAALRAQGSDLKVVLASGYNEQAVLTRCGAIEPDGFVQKPFRYSELADGIRRALGE